MHYIRPNVHICDADGVYDRIYRWWLCLEKCLPNCSYSTIFHIVTSYIVYIRQAWHWGPSNQGWRKNKHQQSIAAMLCSFHSKKLVWQISRRLFWILLGIDFFQSIPDLEQSFPQPCIKWYRKMCTWQSVCIFQKPQYSSYIWWGKLLKLLFI